MRRESMEISVRLWYNNPGSALCSGYRRTAAHTTEKKQPEVGYE